MASNEANSTMLTNLTERFEAQFDSLAREVAGIKKKQVRRSANKAEAESSNEPEVDIGRNAKPGTAQDLSCRHGPAMGRTHDGDKGPALNPRGRDPARRRRTAGAGKERIRRAVR